MASLTASEENPPADWLRVEYEIEKPSDKLLAVTDLDSDT